MPSNASIQITPIVEQPTAMSWQRFHAYNQAEKLYYFLTLYQPDPRVKGILNLYTVNVTAPNVTSVELDNSKLWNLSNMELDQVRMLQKCEMMAYFCFSALVLFMAALRT